MTDPDRLRQSIFLLEVGLMERSQDVTDDGLAAWVITTLSTMVRTRAVPDFAAVQRFQHEKGDAFFELAARPLTEIAPMVGAACLDVVNGELREYGVDVVLRPETLPQDDPRAQALANHEQNLARLAEAGVWHAGPAHPTR
jgi:hypothetical protein